MPNNEQELGSRSAPPERTSGADLRGLDRLVDRVIETANRSNWELFGAREQRLRDDLRALITAAQSNTARAELYRVRGFVMALGVESQRNEQHETLASGGHNRDRIYFIRGEQSMAKQVVELIHNKMLSGSDL